MQAEQFVATADASAMTDDTAEDAAPALANVPLPPRRPHHLGRTVTATR
jgi:hypothetical protein